MAKWDLSKLPEGRKPLPDEWFAERAQMQERIKELEERLKAATDDAKEAEAYAEELEAKLERVTDVALRLYYGSGVVTGDMHATITEMAWRLYGGNDE